MTLYDAARIPKISQGQMSYAKKGAGVSRSVTCACFHSEKNVFVIRESYSCRRFVPLL